MGTRTSDTLTALPALRVGDVTECGTVIRVVHMPEASHRVRVMVTFDDFSMLEQTGPYFGGLSWAGVVVLDPAPCRVCGDPFQCEHTS